MPESLPDNTTIVSDTEFALLRLLPTFEGNDGFLKRTDDGGQEHYVFKQSEWHRMEQIRVAVEIECQTGDALHAELGTEFETFLAKEIKPKPAPPKSKDELNYERVFPRCDYGAS
jgi:hypothetical protein